MKEKVHDPQNKKIFVFGSNLAGIHGAGAALYAAKYLGAVRFVGEGPMQDPIKPRCYAIPTKDENIETLSLTEIKKYVNNFLEFAKRNPQLEFFVSRIGCGFAGYTDDDMSPLFKGAPSNCELSDGWES
jgi:hypothetical protein